MWPLQQDNHNIQWMKAYCKASGHALPTPIFSSQIDSVRVEGSEAKYDSNRTIPTVTYIRPLVLSDVDTFRKDSDQRVVWAMSSVPPNIDDGTLGLQFHDKGYGTVRLDFSQQKPLVDGLFRSTASGVNESKHSKKHDTLITLHG
jgi:hypothetical protein